MLFRSGGLRLGAVLAAAGVVLAGIGIAAGASLARSGIEVDRPIGRIAAAAGLATLDLYEREGLFQRAAELAPQWESAVHSLRGRKNVIDIRNIGLVGAVELAPRDGKPGTRAFDVFVDCFKRGVLVRQTGDIIALSPPLIIEPAHMQEIVGVLGEAIDAVA